MFGKSLVWIYKDEECKRISKEEISDFLNIGWNLGQKPKLLKSKNVKNPKANWSKLICNNCNNNFLASQRDVRRNCKFCSTKCYQLSRSKSMLV